MKGRWRSPQIHRWPQTLGSKVDEGQNTSTASFVGFLEAMLALVPDQVLLLTGRWVGCMFGGWYLNDSK